MSEWTPLDTIKSNIESKRLLVIACDNDIKSAEKRRSQALKELSEWEKAANILEKAAT